MKNLLLTVAASFGVSTAAFAHSPAPAPTPAAMTVIPPAAAYTDWSGFYIGGMASFDSGELDYFFSGVLNFETDLIATKSFGGFIGYNKQVNALIYGGELAFTSGDIGVEGAGSLLTDRVDVKARVGYSFGRAMVYGALGYSWATYVDGDSNPGSGMNFGAGVDYMVTDSIFVGAEYLIRENTSGSGDDTYVIDISTISIRAGVKF